MVCGRPGTFLINNSGQINNLPVLQILPGVRLAAVFIRLVLGSRSRPTFLVFVLGGAGFATAAEAGQQACHHQR